MTQTWRQEAEAYLAVKDRYRRVGRLVTEGFNSKTLDLAGWAVNDLSRGYSAIHSVDMDALNVITKDKGEELDRLTRIVRETLDEGGNVQGYSMGSPFRALLVLQHLWSQIHAGTPMAGRFKGFGTGGDVSFVVPVKGVEDHPEYGARQIRSNGLSAHDLLLGFVEGGETPSVLGAIQEGALITDRNVEFLYCNPDDLLREIGDVAAVHDNARINRTNLTVGPMALAGSTRMQATTVLKMMVGAALFGIPMDDVKRFVDTMADFDYTPFVELTELETDTYNNGEFSLYRAREYAATTGSNHTELHPTFKAPAFENYNPAYEEQGHDVSPMYLAIDGALNHAEAWQFLLGRSPEILDWVPGGISGFERFKGLDISEEVLKKRLERVPGPMHDFNIVRQGDDMQFRFLDWKHDVALKGMHPLFQNLVLKMVLNAHTTLMMGRMGKYEQNMMSFVNLLNYKLVDRGARIVEEKFRREGLTPPDYDKIVYKLFEMDAASTGANDPAAPRAFAALKAEMAP